MKYLILYLIGNLLILLKFLNRMINQNWNIELQQKILFEFLHDYLWLEHLISIKDITAALDVIILFKA